MLKTPLYIQLTDAFLKYNNELSTENTMVT